MSLRMRVIVTFFGLALVPLTIFTTNIYRQFSHELENKAIHSAKQIADQINNSLDLMIQDAVRVSMSPIYDHDVISILHQHVSNKGRYITSKQRDKMSFLLSSLMYKRDQLKGIHIIARDGYVYSYLDSQRVKRMFKQENAEWYREVLDADGGWVLLPLHQSSYYYGKEYAVSVSRLIRDPNTYEDLGIIKIDINPDYIRELLSSVKDTLLVVRDAKGRIIYTNDQSFDMTIQKIEDGNWQEYRNQKYLMTEHTSRMTGITTHLLMPEAHVLNELRNYKNLTFALLVFCALIAFILAIVSSKRLSKPIQDLISEMKALQKKNFYGKIKIHRRDEIGELGRVFNDMIDEINRLIQTVYEKALYQKEAEYKAFQSQINPHFMYNTLETINMMAISKGNLAISDMITTLGKILRYTIDHNKPLVTVKEELDAVKAYMEIMQVRVGSQLHVVWEVDDSLTASLIPKFILQPLIENAIQHGLRPNDYNGEIQVHICRYQNNIEIKVRDTGVGIPKERLVKLIHNLQIEETAETTSETKIDGVALLNIHQRLMIRYGPQYGLTIDSIEGKGTEVIIKIPKTEEGMKN